MIIAKGGKPVAVLGPLLAATPKRVRGVLATGIGKREFKIKRLL